MAIESDKDNLGPDVNGQDAMNANPASTNPWAARHDFNGCNREIRRGERKIKYQGGDSVGRRRGFLERVWISERDWSLVFSQQADRVDFLVPTERAVAFDGDGGVSSLISTRPIPIKV